MKNRFLLLLLLLCTFGLAGNSSAQSPATWDPYWGDIAINIGSGNNMPLFVTIYMDGVQVNNANYEIAGFMENLTEQEGGRVQKIGARPYVNGDGIYYYGPAVYGFDDAWEHYGLNRVTFKIYDHETNTILDATSTFEFDFIAGSGFGTPSDPLPLHFYTQETQWELVTDASTLAEGDVVIITNTDSDKAMDETPGDNTRPAYDITVSNGNITWEEMSDEYYHYYAVQEILVHYDQNVSTDYPLLFASKGYLSAAGAGPNKWLKTNLSANNNSLWSISINDAGEASLVAQGNFPNKNMYYDASANAFGCVNAANTLRIYRKVVAAAPEYYTLTINILPAEAAADGCTVALNPQPGENGYAAGTDVELAAVLPRTTWAFKKWMAADDSTLGTDPLLTVTMSSSISIWAVFEDVTPVETYTVTFNAGSGTCTTTEMTYSTDGEPITLPTATPCDVADEAGWAFAGWATAAVAETTTAPTLLNGTYAPTEDITLYAVYVLGGSMEAVSSLADGDVVYMVSEAFNKELSGFGFTTMYFGNGEDYTDSPAGLFPMTVILNADGTYAFETADGYLNWADGNNNLGPAESITENSSWNVTFNTDNTVALSPVAQEVDRRIAWNNQTNGKRFATYKVATLTGNGAANYGAISLFMAGEGGTYNSNPSCEGPVTTADPVITPEGGMITETSVTVEITCETTGAVIYYTLDGSTPDEESTVYTAPIVITETTTVSAIAIVEGGLPSEVVTATYTFPTYVDYGTIADFKAAYDATSSEVARITCDLIFVFRSGRYVYVKDNDGAGLLIYDNNPATITNEYQNGDVIPGGIIGTMSVYNGQKELIPVANPAAGVAGPAVEPEEVTAEAVLANYALYDAKFVKMVSVTFDEDHEFSNTSAGRSTTFTQGEANYTVYNRFNNLTLTVAAGQEGTVTGFIGIYNDTKQMYPRDNEDIELVPLPVETYTITATVEPAGAGTVNGVATFTQEYEEGETVTLNAAAAEGYVFVNWTEGDVEVSTNATYTFTATADRTLVAHFEVGAAETYTITATVEPAGAGTVNGVATFTQEYEEGETVTLNAAAAEGFVFQKWMEGTTFVSSNPTLTFAAEADRSLVAMFEEETPEPELYEITILENENGEITAPATAEAGATVNVTVTPNEGYLLTGLYYYTTDEEDVTDIDLEAMSFVMPAANVTIGAEFTEETPEPEVYTITVLETTGGTVTAPATAEAGETINVTATPNALHVLTSLYYYTTDEEDVTEIDLEAMSFVMPAANVFIGAEFASTATLGDVNDDDEVNILDVLAVLNYILGRDPQPFDFAQADMNEDGVIDINDAMAINALILESKGNCDEMRALYDVVDGMLAIESPVGIAGYQFHLSAEPASVMLNGFSTMGDWVNGEYILLVFNLNKEQEAGLYDVVNLNGALVNDVKLSTINGCKVIAERGTLSVNDLEASYSIYPVPAKDVVTVEGNGINFIEVFNMMGQRVMTANTKDVNVSNLSAGTYMFRINTEKGNVTKSVIVVK